MCSERPDQGQMRILGTGTFTLSTLHPSRILAFQSMCSQSSAMVPVQGCWNIVTKFHNLQLYTNNKNYNKLSLVNQKDHGWALKYPPSPTSPAKSLIDTQADLVALSVRLLFHPLYLEPLLQSQLLPQLQSFNFFLSSPAFSNQPTSGSS